MDELSRTADVLKAELRSFEEKLSEKAPYQLNDGNDRGFAAVVVDDVKLIFSWNGSVVVCGEKAGDGRVFTPNADRFKRDADGQRMFQPVIQLGWKLLHECPVKVRIAFAKVADGFQKEVVAASAEVGLERAKVGREALAAAQVLQALRSAESASSHQKRKKHPGRADSE